MKSMKRWFFIVCLVMVAATTQAWAADSTPVSSAPSTSVPDKGQKIDVEGLRKKYWSQGEKGEMAIIQNRQYTKAHHLELGITGGSISSDPFLSVYSLGGSLGYYFSESFAVEAIGWKSFSSYSSAFNTLQSNQGLTVQTNPPQGFAGLGVVYSPIYGKLSLLGSAILHFDLNLKAGAGLTFTDNGNYLTPYAGIGQRLYLTHALSLTFDYKLMYYSERLQLNTAAGAPIMFGTHNNWSNVLELGFGFLF